ncbi:MAG: ArsR/SmtB family transcription factor [Christensenellales bacterium]
MAKINKNDNCECDCKPIHLEEKNKAEQILKELNLFDEMTMFFKNFADATRLKIMTILNGVGRICVCDIAVALNMTKSAVSHQLKYLKKYNLVKADKLGKIVFYSLADDHVKDILDKGLEHIEEK